MDVYSEGIQRHRQRQADRVGGSYGQRQAIQFGTKPGTPADSIVYFDDFCIIDSVADPVHGGGGAMTFRKHIEKAGGSANVESQIYLKATAPCTLTQFCAVPLANFVQSYTLVGWNNSGGIYLFNWKLGYGLNFICVPLDFGAYDLAAMTWAKGVYDIDGTWGGDGTLYADASRFIGQPDIDYADFGAGGPDTDTITISPLSRALAHQPQSLSQYGGWGDFLTKTIYGVHLYHSCHINTTPAATDYSIDNSADVENLGDTDAGLRRPFVLDLSHNNHRVVNP
jgi:hypothetical protein